MKLYMVLLGCKPTGRHIEQHDIFFGIGESLAHLVNDIIQSWPEAKGKIHIDAWREVTYVDNCAVNIAPRHQQDASFSEGTNKLFFINLGGYKKNEFEEFHYKLLVASKNKSIAIQKSKATIFYKHTGFKDASSHIDDKYGVDIDDIYDIEDILPKHVTEKYKIIISSSVSTLEDELHLGYFRLENL